VLRHYFANYLLLAASITSFVLSLYSIVFISTAKAQLNGFYFLELGWLGPLNAHIAWYANPVYLLALLKVLVNSSSNITKLSSCALGLGLSSAITLPLTRSVDTYEFYGLGIGYFLWLLALVLLWCHAQVFRKFPDGTRGGYFAPNRTREKYTVILTAISIGFASLLMLVSKAQQSKVAAENREDFSQIVFLLYPRCDSDPYIPAQNKVGVQSALALEANDGMGDRIPWLMDKLLNEWGVDVVRYKGHDFRLDDSIEADGMVVKPASGVVDATLTVRQQYEKGLLAPTYTRASLTDNRTGNIVLDNEWRYYKETREYCPKQDWHSFVRESIDFRIHNNNESNEHSENTGSVLKNNTPAHRSYSGNSDLNEESTIVGISSLPQTFTACDAAIVNGASTETSSAMTAIQAITSGTRHNTALNVADEYYTIPNFMRNLFCVDGITYVYRFMNYAVKDNVARFGGTLYKLQTPDIQMVWDRPRKISIDITGWTPKTGWSIQLISISEHDNGMNLSLGFHDTHTGSRVYTLFDVLVSDSEY